MNTISAKRMTGSFLIAAAAICFLNSGITDFGMLTANAATSAITSEAQDHQRGERPEAKGTRYVGKVTSVSSSAIKVTLGEINRPEKRSDVQSDGTKSERPEFKKGEKPENMSGEKPSGKKPADLPELPANGEKPEMNGEKPADLPEMSSNEEKKDHGQERNIDDMITLSDETKTLAITDDTNIRSGKNDATASDIEEGDYISFLLDDDGNVIEISTDVMMGGYGREGQRPEKLAEKTASN